MRSFPRVLKFASVLLIFAVAASLALKLRGGGLWDGLAPAVAASGTNTSTTYDLTQLRVVNEVLKTVRERYVDPKRVKSKDMLLSALNFVQRDVAQVIVLHEEGAASVKVRVDTQEKEFRVDNVLGPWDVSARLREIFAFVQDGLRGTEVDLREVEYSACNGMLHTLDPHSVLLSPDAYKEMNLSTSGQFGGLGIVISLRDQLLTVMNPMPNTPAGRAGVKKYDRILKINNEATLNMGLDEAVKHLRGEPGTKVTVYIHRDGPDGWKDVKPFELVREQIKVSSVESRLLEGNIGYVRLKQFQQTTAGDLSSALDNLRKGGELKGLVLDLRGNPGGLLDQAAKVADKFIANGPLVATVGNSSEDREVKSAHPDGTEPNYPIALLVSGSSASASEIVAGAMKNHDRAILIGETTFGKGSVQLLFPDFPDKAALKLTIAQYLTEPGDISIQGTGVTPDIQLDPMTADPKEMDLTVDNSGRKERDLSRSLSNTRAKEGQRPLEMVRYNLTQRDRQELRERGGDPDDQFALDFPIKFARDVVAHVPSGTRPEQLRAAKQTINDTRAAELNKVSQELSDLGIDWVDAPQDVPVLSTKTAPPNVDVKLETDKPNNEVAAGEPMNLKLTVTNRGAVPLFRLNAVTKSDGPLFDAKELVIGKVEPGKSKTVSIPFGWCETEGRKPGTTAPLPKDSPRVCKIPRDALTRQDGITVRFEESRNRAPQDMEMRVAVKGLERPTFAYAFQLSDNRKGNGDGRLQKGEGLTMFLSIKNVGKGRSYETQANLRNLSGDGILLKEGRFDISNMQPGDTRKVAFTFDVESQLADQEAKVELSITDRDLGERVVEKVRIPVTTEGPLSPTNGTVRAKSTGAQLFEAAEASSRSFGKLPASAAANSVATTDGFTKVSLGDGRFAFVRNGDVETGGTALPNVSFDDTFVHSPPAIEVTPTVLSTRDNHVQIKGSASDITRLLDGYIFVGAKKVFYRSNRNGTDPKKMSLDADIPLRPGVNIINVFARETPDTLTRRAFVIRRDGANGELLPTPKTEDESGDLGADD